MSVDADRIALAARDCLADAAREAGALALGFFRHGAATSARIDVKAGGSPVTEADLAADALLKARLGAAFPEAGWLSEETADDPDRLARRTLLIVDPIDGTRAFVGGDPRWAVSVALVVDGRPVAGVVHAPALAETYAAARGGGAALNGARLIRFGRLRTRGDWSRPGRSRSSRRWARGSARRWTCRRGCLRSPIGSAWRRAAPFISRSRRGDSHDWDIAAADLVLEEAGARLVDASGERLTYNRPLVRRGPLLGAPDPLAPGLLDAFRAATGAKA